MITVIDYGAGNLRSVENALSHLEAPYQITSQPADVADASAILLPGVGHFGQMMRSLEVLGLASVLRKAISDGVPYLGICLCGTILRFPAGMKVPHMGWNQVRVQGRTRLFAGGAPDSFCYFAHSYYLPVEMNQRAELKAPRIAALTDYGFPFVAAIETDNVYGVQFHPEKSGDVGMQCLSNFIRATGESARRPRAEGSERAG